MCESYIPRHLTRPDDGQGLRTRPYRKDRRSGAKARGLRPGLRGTRGEIGFASGGIRLWSQARWCVKRVGKGLERGTTMT